MLPPRFASRSHRGLLPHVQVTSPSVTTPTGTHPWHSVSWCPWRHHQQASRPKTSHLNPPRSLFTRLRNVSNGNLTSSGNESLNVQNGTNHRMYKTERIIECPKMEESETSVQSIQYILISKPGTYPLRPRDRQRPKIFSDYLDHWTQPVKSSLFIKFFMRKLKNVGLKTQPQLCEHNTTLYLSKPNVINNHLNRIKSTDGQFELVKTL